MKREFAQGSIVAIFSKGTQSMPLIDPNYFENQFDTAIEIGQGISDRGNIIVIKATKLQLDILILNDRIEVKSFSDKSTEEVASTLAKAIEVTNSIFPGVKWNKIGYNYIYNLTADMLAIAAISRGVIDANRISEQINHTVIGAASELWAEVEGSIMWLRMNPRNADRTSNRIIVNANFTEDLADEVLEQETTKRKYIKMKAELDTILKGIGL